MIGDTDNVVKYINEARELGPSRSCRPTSTSPATSSPSSARSKIRFGLGAIRNVGTHGDRLDHHRPQEGRAVHVGVRSLRAHRSPRLQQARVRGADPRRRLDSLGGHRAQYFGGARSRASARRRSSRKTSRLARCRSSARSRTTPSDRRRSIALPNVATWTESERLAKEKEILGFYISGHPLEPIPHRGRDLRHAFVSVTSASGAPSR